MADAVSAAVERQRRQSRVIYAVLVALMALFLIREMNLPFVVGPQATALYDAIEKVPDDKLVVVHLAWAAGTIGESAPQTEALLQHLFMARKRVALFGIDPVGPGLGQQIAERQAKRLGREYGRDWVNWGYRPGQLAMFLGLGRDIPGTLKKDMFGADLSTMPVMAGVKTAHDLGMVIDVASSSTVEIWIQYFHGVYGTPIGYAPTAVMVPEAYPYLQAGQLVGMLAGIKGAAEYAQLLRQRRPDAELTWGYPPTRAMNAISIAHALIVVLIVYGNYTYFTRARRRGAERA
ncbi:MAG: hypothetical protein QHJ73_00865 [Armatimonadota bacterium]|nr:hypothetical protein [Armatimonadota bacterium]